MAAKRGTKADAGATVAVNKTRHTFKKAVANSPQLMAELSTVLKDIRDSNTTADFRAVVEAIRIARAAEIVVEATGKRAIVISVPTKIYDSKVKPHLSRLICEIEKKTKSHVMIISGERKAVPKHGLHTRSGKPLVTPRHSTLTHIHDTLLENVVAPTDVVGRRKNYARDGKTTEIVYLDSRDKTKDNMDDKLHTFASVYEMLTTKKSKFSFAEHGSW